MVKEKTNQKVQVRLLLGIIILMFGGLGVLFWGLGILFNNVTVSWMGRIILALISIVVLIMERFI